MNASIYRTYAAAAAEMNRLETAARTAGWMVNRTLGKIAAVGQEDDGRMFRVTRTLECIPASDGQPEKWSLTTTRI